MICRRDVSLDLIGSACPACGHNGLVHPHCANNVDHCLLCELVEIIEEARG